MPNVGMIADDLTGATTVGSLLALQGIAATVLFRPELIEGCDTSASDAVIINTASRNMQAARAFESVLHTTRDLISIGCRRISKRIDTTCRGNIGAEVEAMLTALGEDYLAVIVPAMPQSRKIVVAGYSLIDSVLLAHTGAAVDPYAPVTESYLPTLLGQQFERRVGHIPLETVLQGKRSMTEVMAGIYEEGGRAVIVDATTAADIDLIARASLSLGVGIVPVDPGPFSERVVLHSGVVHELRGRVKRAPAGETSASEAGTVVMVVGSATAVTRRQISAVATLEDVAPIKVPVLEVLAGGVSYRRELEAARDEAERLMSASKPPRVLLVGLDSVFSKKRYESEQLMSASGLSLTQAAQTLTERLGGIGREVLDVVGSRCCGLYLTGGDVTLSTCLALGAKGMTLIDDITPQVDLGVLVGGSFAGLPVVCKGGLTGTDATAVDSVKRIFEERMCSHATVNE